MTSLFGSCHAKEPCVHSLASLTKKGDEDTSPLEAMTIKIHHNGNISPCGTVRLPPYAENLRLIPTDTKCYEDMDKYDTETFLTGLFAQDLAASPDDGDCSSADDPDATPGLLGHCDMGEDRTPILLDHDKLQRVPAGGSLPCRFYTREGVRISSLKQLADLQRSIGKKQKTCTAEDDPESCMDVDDDSEGDSTVHLYAVPAGRVFMFAPSYVGEIFELPHIETVSGLPVHLEVMSLKPRVFDIFNFFSRDESEELVDKAMKETSPTHKIKRSTTGTSTSTFAKRTSESGFDTHGATAQKIKRRCMRVLGWDEYHEGYTDGLQILRYNTSKSYTTHMDYMDDKAKGDVYDYDSAHKGGNRYATILLYMTDMGEKDGGETVFEKALPLGVAEGEGQDIRSVISDLRASGEASMLKKGSWEEEMVAKCRARLSVRPHSSRAVLFYSQHPNGKEDKSSLHGGCPVLSDQPKWAANLWTWNNVRDGFEGAPIKKGAKRDASSNKKQTQIKAHFRNTGKDPAFKEAELYYDESGYWGKLGWGWPALYANTFEGHKWNIKVPDKGFVKQFVIGKDDTQVFEI
eukprot:CAMPEP_0194069930 /NCGR_PEP_ID=MMETSP0009_2-20130614/87904_1 /TAXON_ID=210454 /ORGANISM="Grammatophora oceanica, Strain CCMP 410" /LENGTH=575 /DNA_ID=CAMNT_0038723157 /DNA_START=19 /DNA_END=1746 /DNA_ORIENTATION=-